MSQCDCGCPNQDIHRMEGSSRSPRHVSSLLSGQVSSMPYHNPYASPRIPWNPLRRCFSRFLPSVPSHKRALSVCLVTGAVFVFVSVFYHGAHIFSGFPSDVLPWRLSSQMKQSLPQCIIVGVRKCGTRALIQFLSLHPQVRQSHEEVHFFDRDERYAQGLEWYRRQMPQAYPDQITIEKTPGYFITREAPERIKLMNESIKLLFIVRDPVTRTISDYAQSYANHQKKNLSYPSFEDLVLDPDTGDISTRYKPTWISLYYLHWLNWQSAFNRSQIHIVNGDQLAVDPVSELQKVEAFLGLDNGITKDDLYFNKTRGFYCIKKGPISRCLNPSKGRPHPDVRPRVLHKLYRFFNSHNEKFFKLTNQYFDWTEDTHRRKTKSVTAS